MNTLTNTDSNLFHALEFSEAEYWGKLYDSTSSLNAYGCFIASAYARALPGIDILAMNRVFGLGLEDPATPDDIDRILAFYRKIGAKRFFIQVSPYAKQQNLPGILKEKGFRYHNNWVKLLRTPGRPLPEVKTALSVEEAGPESAETYGRIIFESFGWEDERLIDWFAASVGKQGYRHYLVKHRNHAVAAGALHVSDAIASMALAGTLRGYRGKGAQSLLLKTRIQRAVEAGCTYMVSETGEEKPGKPVPSFRNMQRFGFEVAYLRQNWIYEF